VLLDALESGYVWDERSTASSSSPSTRRPKKDGYYDHCMNCLEYGVLRYGPAASKGAAREQAVDKPVPATPHVHNPSLSWM
jgi:hypothetical protein